MPALNYAAQFAPKVADGSKTQTIRSMRKRPFQVGDMLYHFNRQRHTDCKRLGFSIAEEVLSIDIFDKEGKTGLAVYLAVGSEPDSGQRRLSNAEVRELAKADGFENIADFYAWFVGSRPHFRGQLIKWPTTWSTTTCPNAHVSVGAED